MTNLDKETRERLVAYKDAGRLLDQIGNGGLDLADLLLGNEDDRPRPPCGHGAQLQHAVLVLESKD